MLASSVGRGISVVAFCVGLVVGALVSAAVFLIVGSVLRWPLPSSVAVGLVAVATVALLARELGLVSFRLPENQRLVPDTVFRLGRWWGPFQFGLEMGTGARTYLPTSLAYALAFTVLLLANVPGAILAGLGFGLGRSLMTWSSVRFDLYGGWDIKWIEHSRLIRPALLITYAIAAGLLLWSAA